MSRLLIEKAAGFRDFAKKHKKKLIAGGAVLTGAALAGAGGRHLYKQHQRRKSDDAAMRIQMQGYKPFASMPSKEEKPDNIIYYDSVISDGPGKAKSMEDVKSVRDEVFQNIADRHRAASSRIDELLKSIYSSTETAGRNRQENDELDKALADLLKK